jgi:hypothetical protein
MPYPKLDKVLYWVVQLNGTGNFKLAPCSELIQPKLDIGNDGDWAVASGPYDGIDVAGKALSLAVESYDRAVENSYIEAREQLADVVRDSVYVNEAESRGNEDTLEIDHIELMIGIRELLEDWD